MHKLIQKYVKTPYVPRILDIGCGPAYFSKFYQYTGIDPNAEDDAPNILKTRIEDVELTDKYDVILALDVLEHLEDDRVILRFLQNNLKNNGIAIITVPAHPWLFSEHDRVCGHYRRYTKKQLKELFRTFDCRIYYYNSLLFPAEVLYRLLTKGKNNLKPVPALLNKLLLTILSAEYYFLPVLPVGLSLIAIVKKGSDLYEWSNNNTGIQ
ncbi:class I SAM-dependent methyltransferase [Anaerocellum danielii]|uniref:Class I SAM-dependent methyltransferase n=1 Tax=Anaerocellum danielii TaxID=1387557 RepID=A0ABZ0TY55_9FIRM|nr:class I SAM-dependent methyltransferase [Caldicellulosiruptor danielii]WPX08164.1 class I SAM-dependent methyltransferase [Caldicellulosiruptor danielii]